MNKHIDQSELSNLVSQNTGTDRKVVDLFIQYLSTEIENRLKSGESVKVDPIGTFRTIQSGSVRRILFLGNNPKTSSKTHPNAESSQSQNEIEWSSTKSLKIETLSLSSDQNSDTEEENTISSDSIAENDTILETDFSSEDNSSKEDKKEEKQENSTPNEQTDNENTQESVHVEISLPENSSHRDPVVETAQTLTRSGTQQMNNSQQEYQSNNQNVASQQLTKQRKPFVYIGIGLLVGMLLGTFITVAIVDPSQNHFFDENPTNTALSSTNLVRFAQVENVDSENFSCVILVDREIPIHQLAILYYGNELFWPYIFKANEKSLDITLVVHVNTLIRIPKIRIDLVNYSTGDLNTKLQEKGNKIRKEIGISEE